MLALVASAAASPCGAQHAAMLSESAPVQTMPATERPPVLPERVLRWRTEARSYEHGDGVPRDPALAAQLYCRAARYGDAEAQYSLAWMLAHARGIARNDAQAAHLFAAAAEQGHPQAQAMAQRLGAPIGEPPACLQPPDSEAVAQPPPAPPAPPVRVAAVPVSQRPRAAPPPPPPPPAHAPAPIVNFVRLVAPDYQLEPHLVLAVIATESNFDPLAVSPKNAQGLMQLIPDTARRFNVLNASDPVQNIRGGMAYLRWLLAYFEGDLALALAAYNAGERAVERYRGVPPYAETRMYVRRIIAAINGQRTHPFDARVTPPSPVLAELRAATR